jgi:outer membrane protein OmpA-like peptidoglycan-associated protein
MDECPDIAGLVGTKGCPDSDNDGVIDSKDRCPNEAGIANNKGCPEVDQETKDILQHTLTGVQFESGKDVIKRSSYKDLDDVARIMQSHSGYKLKLSG